MVRTRENVGESVLAHVGRLNGSNDRAWLGVVGTQCVPLLLQTVLVRQVIFHVRLAAAAHTHTHTHTHTQ